MENQNIKPEIDIAQYAKEGKEVPKDHYYIIMVDRNTFTVKVECMTGCEILLLAGKVPVEKYQLNEKFKGGEVKKIGLDQKVCFTAPGVERFMTLPLDQTEG